METLVNYHASYKDFKQVLDSEMHKVAEGFVKIGFLLNFASETNIVEEGGYANTNEFAKAEYGIDATQVSRFVNIYKRFGVPGEPRLQDQYSNHGVAKLGIMLTLPEYITEEIDESYSKSEITAIKHEVEEEKQISDIEVMCEEKSTLQQLLPEGLKQLAMQFVKDYPKEYMELYDAVTLEDVKDILAPNEVATYSVRIPAVGKILIFVKANENIVTTNTRSGDKDTYEWENFFNAIKDYFILGTDAKESWCNIFKEPWPLEEKKEEEKPVENASKPHKDNVQQAKPKKESKVKVVEPKKEKTPAKSMESVESSEPVDEQLPGQDSIMNHPEYLPDEMKEDKQEVLTGEVEDIENTDCDNEQQVHAGMKVEHFAPVQETDEQLIKTCKEELAKMVDDLGGRFAEEQWDKMSAVATSIVWKIKTLKKLMEESN